MTLFELKKDIKNQLQAIYPDSEIESFIRILYEDLLNLPLKSQLLKQDDETDSTGIKQINEAVEKLKKQIPIQYITKQTEFYGRKFYLNKHVLIPRPETEELVDLVLNDIEAGTDEKINIIDIGTGSGCIAVSLAAELKNANVFALDISKKALKTAKKNAELNKVNVNFVKDNILSPNTPVPDIKFDIIVSNPPYVTESEKTVMRKNVLDYEPAQALFVPDNKPLIFYKAIIKFARNKLKNRGHLYFEINEAFADKIVKLLHKKGFTEIYLHQDINGKDRIISARKAE